MEGMSWVRSFSAMWVGTCGSCYGTWLPGEPIAYVEDVLMHAECASEELDSIEWERWEDE